MLISPFTPIFFGSHRTDGVRSRYVQTFSRTDHILLQVIRSVDEAQPDGIITNTDSGFSQQIPWLTWAVNSTDTLDFCELSGLSEGRYVITVAGIESQPFDIVASDAMLKDTTLIQYSMKDNRQRKDMVSFIDGMQYFFDFRVPGGFKDSGWSFSCDNEQFVTDKADVIELYASDSVQKKFTMGTARGCPIWFGELLNRLLCCTYVYFDGVRYARKDSSVPEVSQQLDTLNSFIFTQQLQQVNNINPTIENNNQMIIRRIVGESNLYRKTDDNNIIKL